MCVWRSVLVCLLVLALPGVAKSEPPKSEPPDIAVAQLGPRHPTPAREDAKVARVNDWTVGVAGGQLEATLIRFAAELAKALDDGDNLRILPIISYGVAENVSDLLYLHGIDVAITAADALDSYKKSGEVRNIQRRINYIAPLYTGELHVFARPEIATLADLEGKKVGFNTKGAGPTTTGPIVFERLGIHVEPVFINNAIAVEKMRTGEIAAILHTVGKPNDFFIKLPPMPGFHFIPVEYNEKLADYYVPSTLTHDDYPNWIPEGQPVNTIGVQVVLAAYNWPKGSDRYRRIERFIEYMFDRFDRLRQPSFHPKWRDVNLAAPVPGWTRHPVAQQKVSEMLSMRPSQSNASDNRRPPSNDAHDRLFQNFLEWQREHPRQ